jgi:two-component system chemotaxis response regulator CheY
MSKLLIVDDSSTMRKIIRRTLCQADVAAADILEAESGLQALRKLEQEPGIDLILTDVNMPEMNGVELVKAVRTRHSKEELPIIVLTTESGEALTLAAIEHGANATVCKPFTPETIRSALEPYVSPTFE